MSLRASSQYNLIYVESSLLAQWSDFLTSLKLEVVSDPAIISERCPYYLLFSDPASLEIVIDWECKIYATADASIVVSGTPLAKFYSGQLDISCLKWDWGRDLLARAFNFPASFKIESRAEHAYYRWTCDALLHLGTFSDQILLELAARDYKVDQAKKYLDELFFFYSYTQQSEITRGSYEIELLIYENWFSLQIVCESKSFWHEYCEQALRPNSDDSAFAGILSRMNHQCLAHEILHLKSSERLCLTSIFSRNPNNQSETFILHEIESFALKQETLWEETSAKSHLRDVNESQLVAGAGPEVPQDENQKIVSLKRVIRFLERKCYPSELKRITPEQIKVSLADYPNPKVVRALTREDYKFIVKCLHDETVGGEFKKSFEDVYQMNAEESFLDGMLKKLDHLSLEDAGELIFDGNEDFSETLTKVGGWVESAQEETTLVKGSAEAPEAVTVVKGQREDLGADARYKNVIKSLPQAEGGSDTGPGFELSREQFQSKAKEMWEVKRSQILEVIKGEVANLREQNPTVSDVASTVRAVISRELKIDAVDCQTFVDGLVEFSSTPLLEKKLGRSSEEVREELENLKFKLEINKKDDQLRRMKRIIDSMKEQIGKQSQASHQGASEEKASAMNDSREWQGKLNSLELENEELRRNLKALEISHERQIEQQKREQIEEQEAAAASSEDVSAVVAEEIIERERTKNEKSLEAMSSKLGVAETRIEVMSSKLEEQRRTCEEALGQKTAAESRSNMSAAAMSKYKAKAESLERKVRQLEETMLQKEAEIDKLQKDNKTEQPTSEEGQKLIDEQQKEIQELKNNLAEAEKNLKGSLLKIKQYEQKAKFMSSQLENAKRAAPGASGSGAGGSPQLEHKIKQLENMNSKIGAASQKLNDELTEKKKEVLDLKKENMALQNKLKALERKSGKNAA